MLKKLILFLSIICFLYSCETDFDVHADWKDHTIVYSLLNPSDSIHYVKVYKAFLGPDNALTMAQDTGLIYYTYNEIEVVLINLNTETEYALRDTILDDLNQGNFANSPNKAFYFVGDLNDSHRYRLEVRKQNDIVFGETSIIENREIDNNISSVYKFFNNLTNDYHTPRRIKFPKLDNAYYYEVDFEFHYKEWDWNNDGDTIHAYVDWRLGDDVNPLSDMDFWLESEEFFQKIKTRIEANPNVQREFTKIVISYSASEKELYNYISINEQAANSLLFELPVYTNIIGSGSGVFSSRRFEQKIKYIDSDTRNRLVVDPHTLELNFIP